MTGALQMIRAEISVRDFQRWMGIRQLPDPDHGMHCLLTECFGREDAPKPFRTMFPRDGHRGCLYGYGSVGAAELQDAASAYADPLQYRIIPAHTIDSKPMPTVWSPGKRLGFEVRVRPIVRRTGNAACRPGREWDAFQLAAVKYPKGEMPHSREEVYCNWLCRQFESRGGAKLESATLVSFQRTRAVRKLHGRHSEGPDALMRGVLEVTDGPAFTNLLAGGIGRHRSYGYGMLLLRPVIENTGR